MKAILTGVAIACSILLGAVTGCLIGDCPVCEDPIPMELGSYEIVEAEDAELIGGEVEIAKWRVTISYERNEGSSWLVEYRKEF
jgi:hypothetical protein